MTRRAYPIELRTPWGIAVILLAVTLAYANSFRGAFVFDDVHTVIGNPHIRSAWPPWESGSSPFRIVGAWTFALTYAWGGLEPFGYHLGNLLIHAACALCVYALVAGLCATSPRLTAHRAHGQWLGLSAALIWCVHPLTTQAVTYVSQRYESLAVLFYLLVLLLVQRGIAGGDRSSAFMLAILCAALGMCCKQIMYTAPALAVALDRIFHAKDVREIASRRGLLYAGLALTWLSPMALGLLMPPSEAADASMGSADLGTSRFAYLMVQGPIVLHYMRLCLLPVAQVFDYGWTPLIAGVTGASVLGVLLIGVCALFALVKGRPIGFLGLLFFGVLAPTSTIFPIDDFAVEHRLYLPLLAPCVIAAFLLARLCRAGSRRYVCVLLILILALGSATHLRNRVYSSRIALWHDVVSKRPDNARAYLALGSALMADGQWDVARTTLDQGRDRLPDLGDLVYGPETRGSLTLDQRRGVTLLIAFENSLAALAKQRGDMAAAEAHYRAALAVHPGYARARNGLAALYADTGRQGEATQESLRVLETSPLDPAALHRLAIHAQSQGDFASARTRYAAMPADHALGLRDYAWFLATCPEAEYRDGAKALELARRAARELTGDPRVLDVLSAASAAAGDFTAAEDFGRAAITALAGRNADYERALRERLSGYAERRPYREERTP